MQFLDGFRHQCRGTVDDICRVSVRVLSLIKATMFRDSTFSKSSYECVNSKISLTCCTKAGAVYQNVLDSERKMANLTSRFILANELCAQDYRVAYAKFYYLSYTVTLTRIYSMRE